MVQNKHTTSLGSLMTTDTAKTNSSEVSAILTPTTTKILSQILEAEDLQHKLGDKDCFVVPLPPTTTTTPSANSSNSSSKIGLNNNRKSFIKLDSSSWQGCTTTVVTPTKSETLSILDMPTTNNMPTLTMTTRSSSGARKATGYNVSPSPTLKKRANVKRTPKQRPGVKSATSDADLAPEDAAKLKVRRERNKAAAARCRKRRLDQIATLTEEVESHEDKKRALESTIAQLKAQKEELEFILSQHQSECNLAFPSHLTADIVAIKSEPVLVESMEQVYTVQPAKAGRLGGLKPKRPLSLNITTANEAKPSTVEGVVIDTPSNIVASLGFDTLMTSTGLTPTTNIITPVSFNLTTPTCSTQQRSTELVLSDLNTPSNENVSLVSL